MISFDDAQHILVAEANSFGKETISLEDAFGRVLAEKIFADRDYPPFNRSAMDGFAMSTIDLEKGIREFEIIETIYAGQEYAKTLTHGQCYRIMTGAALPTGADLVIRKEDTEERKDLISLKNARFLSYQNVSKKGEDAQGGTLLIDHPVACNSAVISLLATLGKARLSVERLPNVAIITTGNEVVGVNEEISPVHIRNSNQAMLIALLRKHSIKPISVQHVQDEVDLLRKAIVDALDADIVISCGGVSAGNADFVPGVLQEIGVKELFHKVAIKPGKPIWCGKAQKKMVFALPGNPFSCLVTFTLFLQHYLHACCGLTSQNRKRFFLQGERNKKSKLDEFFPVRCLNDSNAVQSLAFNGSGDIRAALFAEGLALHAGEKSRIADELVDYFSL